MFIDEKEYQKRLKVLEGIEQSTGVDMGFQKGRLSALFAGIQQKSAASEELKKC